MSNKEANMLTQAQLEKIKEGFVGVLETCKDVDSLEDVHIFFNKESFQIISMLCKENIW